MLRRLWERNLSVIPVSGKVPVIKEWQKYTNELPTEEEIELWERKYPFPQYGIGICPGAASGVIVIDWDTESPDIKSLIPPSPVIRFGAKGGASFYKYNPQILSSKVKRDNLGVNKDLYKHEGIEVFATSGMIVLPPSIHPVTGKEYIWRTLDTLENFSKEELPHISLNEVEEIRSYIKLFKVTNDKGETVHGEGFGEESRNGKLTQIVCAIIANGSHKKDEEIAKEIYDHDQREFGAKSYFHAKDRQHNKKARGNASLAALYFVQEHRKRMIKKGLATAYEEIKSIDVHSLINPPPVKDRTLPECTGLIRAIQQTVLRVSRSKQEDLALGASLAMLAALTSNKFHIMGVPAITHLYIMNVARSGVGKGSGFHIANTLFGPGILEKHNLIGLRNYSSVPAFIGMLPVQRSRLDLVDEFGSVVESFIKGSQLAKDTETLLNELFTDRGGYWKGHYTATSGWKGGCYSPAVTIYANIQEDTLTSKASKSMIDSGLLGRFLYFSGKTDAEYNFNFCDAIDLSDLANEINRIFPFYKLETVMPDGSVVTDPGKVDPKREPLLFAAGFKEYRSGVDFEMYKRENDLAKDGKSSQAALISRSVQIAERIAIINAIGCDRRIITKDDLDFGLAVVKHSSRRSEDYLSNVSAGSNLERKIIWAKKALKSVSHLTHSKLLKNSHMDAGDFAKLIKTMKESDIIEEFIDQQSSKKCYRLKA